MGSAIEFGDDRNLRRTAADGRPRLMVVALNFGNVNRVSRPKLARVAGNRRLRLAANPRRLFCLAPKAKRRFF